MPIKSDKWIRRMCEEHRMIEPFESGQIRDGKISYGLSSYGYDIRVSSEFKVFTNVYNAVVDPKSFDARSFVDICGPECIIPPNSFALARTEEYFRIPRNVLAICVGKSTYARCFSADTRVALVDGSAPTFEEMAERHEQGEMFWGYGLGASGRVEVVLLDAPRLIGRDPLLEIELDNGRTVRATADHAFIRRDGRRVIADELRPGDSLMPLYRSVARGYEAVYQPVDGRFGPTHRPADGWNVRHRVYDGSAERTSAARTSEEGMRARLNHTVVSVRGVPGEHDVYCLTVPEAGNFALDAGIFVENCGLVVNVTPLEPTWEGYLTLEISNTTPLPAKVYGGEGIAQLLFLEGDELPEIAYADRKGKYMNQQGVTLPKL
ncbi:MAG: dCTP deaminase [Gemmatimonadales bacterium]